MKLVHTDKDYHAHTINFSDGFNTVDEVVQYAGRIGLKELAITDHSQAANDRYGRQAKNRRAILRYENVHNDVKVVFGVEADLLSKEGDICGHIAGLESDFLILSAHEETYRDEPHTVTDGYLNAMERHKDRIVMLSHVDAYYFGHHTDVKRVVEAANKHGIIVELNAKNLFEGRNVPEQTKVMLDNADQVMVSSDAHTLADFNRREVAFRFLKDNGYINEENV